MDELISQITQRTGVSEAQARQAVQIVADFLKTKLPAPLAGQIDAALSGGAAGGLGGQAGQMLGGLGDMFGKKS